MAAQSKTPTPKPIDRWLALVGIAMGIAIFLVPKTPLVIILSLIGMFLALCHPAWNFWWIEESRLRRILALIVLAALHFGFGVFVWPPKVEVGAPPSPSNWTVLIDSLSGWAARCMVHLSGLPWRWIAPSVALGALAVGILAFLRERRRRALICPNQQLHNIAASDREQIHDRLKLIGVECVKHFGDVPYIDFVFRLYNLALISVSIDDAIVGRIVFYKDRQSDGWTLRQATMDNLAKHCRFRVGYHFTIRQEVSLEEAALIESSPDSRFYFGDLKITMHGEWFSGVRFGTSFQVDTKTGYWPGYAYGDAGSQTLIKVKSALKQEPDGGGRVALWERNPAHPGGEVFVASDTPVEAALTLEVVKAIQDGKLTIVE